MSTQPTHQFAQPQAKAAAARKRMAMEAKAKAEAQSAAEELTDDAYVLVEPESQWEDEVTLQL